MSNSDLERFKKIVNGKVKSGLDKFVASDDLIAQQGNKIFKIPMKYIELPRFTYGSLNGGTGMGGGDIGDGMGKPGKGKPGQGKASDDTAEHEPTTDFTETELAELLIEKLELPHLEDKKGAKTFFEKLKYNKIATNGSEALRHNKRTFKEAIKRQISSGAYNPNDPKIIPIKCDKRYRSSSQNPGENTNTCVFYIIDCSGSMTDEFRRLAKATSFWINALLKYSYKNIENVFIIHDTEPQEVDAEIFFSANSNGGTKISPAYEMCLDIIKKEYPTENWNSYIYAFTDSDNLKDDNEKAIIVLKELLKNSNKFSYINVGNRLGDFYEHVERLREDNFSLEKINSNNDILPTIKSMFKENK